MENKITCNDVRALADSYIDGELSDTERAAFEAHLEECRGCKEYVERRRAVADAVTLSADEPPQELKASIITAIQGSHTKKRGRRVRQSVIFAFVAVLCTAVAIFMATSPVWSTANEPGGAPIFDTTSGEIIQNSSSGSPDGSTASIPEAVTPPTNAENSPTDEDIPSADEGIPPSDNANGGDGENIENEVSPDLTESSTPPVDINPPAENDAPPSTRPITDGDYGQSENDAPDEDDITLAVLILSGLLAVASFVAFLISLSSIRNYQTEKKDSEDGDQ